MMTLRVYPNGEFGLAPKRKFSPKPLKRDRPKTLEVEYSWSLSDSETLQEFLSRYKSIREGWEKIAPGYYDAVMQECCSIDLSSVPKNHKRRKRGEKGITAYGRKNVRNAAYLLGERIPRRNLGFLTLTLPPMSLEDEVAVTRAWDEILRVFLQWLKRSLERAGHCSWVVGCVEVQPKRASKYGGLPLHLHAVFQARRKGKYLFSPKEIREKWRETVTRIAGLVREYYWDACENLQAVRRSAEQYLGKYLSKGVPPEACLDLSRGYRIPRAWWFAVGGVKKVLKKRVVYRSGEAASRWYFAIHENPELFEYVGAVVPNPEVSTRPCAWYGKALKGVTQFLLGP